MLCNTVISRLWWQLTISLINLCNTPCVAPRYFFTDFRFRWYHGAPTVRPVSEGGSQITYGSFWGTFLWLHWASCTDVLRTAGEGPSTMACNLNVSVSVLVSTPQMILFHWVSTSPLHRKRSPSILSWIHWCQTRPLSVWCGYCSCIGLPMSRTVRQDGIFLKGWASRAGRM